MSKEEKKRMLYKLRVLENLMLMDKSIENRDFYFALIHEISRNLKAVR